MSNDDTVVMDIVFQPPQVKSYSVNMCMVCDNYNVKHFSIKGKYIVSHDDTVVMDIVFQPPQVKSYSVDICMVCDNCNVKHFYIKGKYYCEP